MLFKKKKPEPDQLPTLPKIPDVKTTKPETTEQKPEPVQAPLFIKLDRYREIISNLTQLKTLVAVVKNSLSTLIQLEKARDETIQVVKKTLSKIDEKLSILDKELVRPTGFAPTTAPEYHEIQSVETTIAGLKGQIEQLKAELQALSG